MHPLCIHSGKDEPSAESDDFVLPSFDEIEKITEQGQSKYTDKMLDRLLEEKIVETNVKSRSGAKSSRSDTVLLSNKGSSCIDITF